VLASPEEVRDPELLARLIRAERITALQATPSLWAALLSSEVDLSGVRALVGGEALPVGLARALVDRAASVTNLYGPTEVTVWATRDDVDGAWAGTIGRPLPGTTAQVLDERLNPVPPGVIGELYLGGAQVTRGYLGRPGLTASRFVAAAYGRLYRTGDLARWRPDGRLEFLGRADHQVKVRGFRIEPEEIEAVALAHPPVTQAVVITRDDRLIAYLASSDGTVPAFADQLPGYMVPSAVHVLPSLPLTPNGKIDRAALPDVVAPAGGTAPRSRVETVVCGIVESVLGVPAVGVHDDFFALGAHSLMLVRLAASLRQALGAEISVASLFAAPTVAGVARLVAAGAPAGDALAPVLTLSPGSGPPLFCLPPASGLTWQFAALRRHLDVPLIGLQSPTLSGLPAPVSLAALAAAHADRVAELAPSGPIRLLGWSFGGALALVLAAELRARGRSVSFVGMLDTRRSADTPGDVSALLAELGFEVPPGDLTVADAVALIRASDDPVGVLTDAQIALVIENYLAGDRLLASAAYPAYPGEVLFVDATVDGAASAGWAELPRLSRHGLPVAHSEMLDPAAIELLGPLLAAAL
jgi:thioesterase domain-containing protein/acyl carrier protein